MVATFDFREWNAGPVETTSLSNINFGNADLPNMTPSAHQIIIGQNSYEKWVFPSFQGTYNAISNIKFYKSAGAYATGEVIMATTNHVFVTPTIATSTIATSPIPTTLGTALSVNPPGSVGNPGGFGNGGFIILQLQTTTSTPTGTTATKTFTLQYDEN